MTPPQDVEALAATVRRCLLLPPSNKVDLSAGRAAFDSLLAIIKEDSLHIVQTDALLKQRTEERDEARASLEWRTSEFYSAVAHRRRAEARAERYEELIRKFRQWDALDVQADGPYWKRTIDAALEGES